MRHLLIAATLLLGACQGSNPYRAESRPLPPAPPQAAGHFDASAYPAAPRDFSRYRSWRWQQQPAGMGALSGAEVADLLAQALDQRGLRPAQGQAPADLTVTLDCREERRIREAYDQGGGYYGNGPWGDHYGVYREVPLRRQWEERVLVVEIRLQEAASGEPLWSGQAEALAGDSQAERRDALRQAVHNALSDYPPR